MNGEEKGDKDQPSGLLLWRSGMEKDSSQTHESKGTLQLITSYTSRSKVTGAALKSSSRILKSRPGKDAGGSEQHAQKEPETNRVQKKPHKYLKIVKNKALWPRRD